MGSTPIGISGSRAAAVLGLSKYKTPVQIWQEICEAKRPGFNAERGYVLEPFEGNPSTRFGLAFESAVIELTEQQTGEKITDQEGEYCMACDCDGGLIPQAVVDMKFCNDFSLSGLAESGNNYVPITCHIDGRFSPEKIYEGKTVYIRGFDMNWGEPGTDRIPEEYQVQCQHNMLLTGAKECHVSALIFPRSPQEWEDEGWDVRWYAENGGNELYGLFLNDKFICSPEDWADTLSQMGYFKTYTVKAKPELQDVLKTKYLEFWQKYILTETPPPIDGFQDLRNLFPSPIGTLVVSDHVASQCREYKDIGKEIGSGGFLKKKQVQLKTDILKLCLTETTVADDESIEKIVLRDSAGNKCGSFDGKTFRA